VPGFLIRTGAISAVERGTERQPKRSSGVTDRNRAETYGVPTDVTRA
jgi:hypothetical protein